ncbi:EscU/YscU/HrcU family type III secretion system export apparatus switch protein [Chitinasiproducens palmae]|uniref:Type III secretion protein U n=1 Tax=Chitinasiproducens palmae TaxID=1770053 RepID=A0A1H2PK09_9BURK|nr:EscU/YscU/HrcU family type III secretion system export apparatus switch protein [Chitinasiproducens palmae]SDV46288.1 type III secretion protein U [Chitinasiproducens palmae]
MAEKTEKATPQKLARAARKGQMFVSRDFVTTCVLGAAALALPAVGIGVLRDGVRAALALAFGTAALAAPGSAAGLRPALEDAMSLWLRCSAPLLLICFVVGAVATLAQTRLRLAVEAMRPDLAALHPARGFKRLFRVRTLKDALKAVIVMLSFGCATTAFVRLAGRRLFALPSSALDLSSWAGLTQDLVLLLLAAMLPLLVLDAAIDHLLFHRQMRMDKHEVKQEIKRDEGDPHVKYRRRDLRAELLDDETKASVRESDVVLANPTHFAVGLYVDETLLFWPMVSVRERNARALAVIAYAESVGVPVVRDPPLARRVYRTATRYSLVHPDQLEAVLRVLIWLREVELAANDPGSGASGADDVRSAPYDGDPAAGVRDGAAQRGTSA